VYRTVLGAVLCGCDIWFVILREENRLRVNIIHQLMHFYIQ